MPVTYSNTFRLIFLLLGIPAGIQVFLPFTYGVSPLDAVEAGKFLGSSDEWRLALLGIPFFSALFILAWKVRLWVPISVKQPEIIAGYSIAGVFLLATGIYFIFSIVFIVDNGSFSILEWALFSINFVLILLCLVFNYMNFRRHVPSEAKVHLSLLSVYFPNTVLCLWGFYGDWQIGAYLALYAVIVYLIEIVLITSREWRGQNRSVEL